MIIEILMWFAIGCGAVCFFRLFFSKNHQAVHEVFAVAYFILATLLAILKELSPHG